MVHYEQCFIDYPSSDMYTRGVNYSPTAQIPTTMYNTQYNPEQYNAIPQENAYYNSDYRAQYWPPPPQAKEEPTSFGAWTHGTYTDQGLYVKQQDCYSPQAMQAAYTPCAMTGPQLGDEELLAEEHRQQQYGWITSAQPSSCGKCPLSW